MNSCLLCMLFKVTWCCSDHQILALIERADADNSKYSNSQFLARRGRQGGGEVWNFQKWECLGKWWPISVYIYCLFLFAQKKHNQNAISFWNKVSNNTSVSLISGFGQIFQAGRTVDWSKLLKFGRTCSNWQSKIRMNTKIVESTIFKT